MELPKRKHPRLKEYDYSQNGCYFATICIQKMKPILATIRVGRDAHIPPIFTLTDYGKISDKYIQNIEEVYDGVIIDKYVIMPNHIHLLISLSNHSLPERGGMRASRPTLHTIIRSFKTMVSKAIGVSIWQTSYYDRIIRNDKAYRETWQYIDENPANWTKDELYKT